MMKKLILHVLIITCISLLSWDAAPFSGLDAQEEDSSKIPEEFLISSQSYHPDLHQYGLCTPTSTNLTCRTRNNTQIRRPFSGYTEGHTHVKDGKLINRHSFIAYLFGFKRFPSGLNESTHYFIRLGKLVI